MKDDLIKAIEYCKNQILVSPMNNYTHGYNRAMMKMEDYLLSLQSQQGVAMSGNIDAKDYIIGEDLKTNLERQSVGPLKEDDFSNLKESEIFKPAKSNDADEKDSVDPLHYIVDEVKKKFKNIIANVANDVRQDGFGGCSAAWHYASVWIERNKGLVDTFWQSLQSSPNIKDK